MMGIQYVNFKKILKNNTHMTKRISVWIFLLNVRNAIIWNQFRTSIYLYIKEIKWAHIISEICCRHTVETQKASEAKLLCWSSHDRHEFIHRRRKCFLDIKKDYILVSIYIFYMVHGLELNRATSYIHIE